MLDTNLPSQTNWTGKGWHMTNLGLKLVQMLVPASKWDIKCPNQMLAQRLTIHNTANNASALAEISYMIGNNSETSFHWAVDDIQAVQGITHDRNAWHCGDGVGQGNMSSIGIEICHSLDPQNPRYGQSEENGAKLAALILHQMGWGIDLMFKHQDWSGKYCPHRILDNNGWANFKNKVQGYLDQLKNGACAPAEKKEEEEEMNFVVRSKSGKHGYVGVINGNVFGIGNVNTVHQFMAAGAKELNLDDGDFVRFIESQKTDDEKVIAILTEVKQSIEKNK